MDLDALTDDVLARCDVLAGCSEEPGRLTRTFLRPPVHDVHRRLRGWMEAAGLAVRLDAVGNLIGRRPAQTDDARVFVVGSHIDTVPDAGKYDGVLGVLLGVAAAQALAGRPFRRTLDVIAFSEEEGVRFRTPYLGSLAVCGRLGPELLARTDADGVSVADAIRAFGLDPAGVPAAAYPPGQVAGYFEAHIEQGPVLEAAFRHFGVVTAIVGQSRYWLRFVGRAGHAGAQPMGQRRDALAAAAEFITAVEKDAQTTDGLRATVGCLTVSPGAANVVPGEVRLSLDVRHEDDTMRAVAGRAMLNAAKNAADYRCIEVECEQVMDEPAVPMDGALTGRLKAAAGPGVERLVSGAGHDAAVMASICPAAMLFLRSPGGVSHHPAESVRREDVRAALGVMVRFLETELDL
ncbi:MAG TPA: allantoate amidohydrolase [Gemmataceae bacterium]